MVQTASNFRGPSIPVFSSKHKSYVDHSKHRPYQPENTEEIPGPGKYNNTFVIKPKKAKYSFGINLKRFNDNVG